MSRDKKEMMSTGVTESTTSAPVEERLTEADMMELDRANTQKRLALANAEKALAENNLAELGYKYTVLALYMKHGMKPTDSFDEKGVIHRNAAGTE